MTLVKLDTRLIVGWDSFHDSFAKAFGFPSFYGRNMNAWIDCLSYLDDENAGMSTVHCHGGDVVTLELMDVDDFASRCPEQYTSVLECSAFVNWRRIEQGNSPVLALSFHKSV